MALDIKTMVTEATNTPTSKGDTAFNNRLEALRAKMADVTIHFENLDKEAYKSKETLSKFNSSLRGASHAVERLEKDLKDVRSKIFAAGGVPAEFRQGIEKYKAIGVSVSELVKVQNEIGKALAKLKGPATSAATFRSLASSIARGQGALPSEGPIRASFAGGLSSAAGQLYGAMAARGAAQIGRAGAQPTFSMVGKGAAETLDAKLMKDQLRDQRTASAQARMYSMRGPGMFEAMYEGEYPTPKFGKGYVNKRRLPTIPGGAGGGGGGIGGPPTRYMGPAGLPGPYMGGIAEQEFWTRGTSGPWRSRYEQPIEDAEVVQDKQGSGWLKRLGRDALIGGGMLGSVAGLAYDSWSALTAAARPGYPDLERISRAGRIAGSIGGPEGMRRQLVTPGTELGMSPLLARLGYPTAADLADVYSSYGSSYRSTQAVLGATRLSQGPFTGFQDAPAWAEHLQRLQSMGVGTGAGGLDANIKAIEEGTRIGVMKGMPNEQVFHNMETFLRIMATTNTPRTPAEIARFATLGATNSALPGVRDLSALQSQQSAYKDIINQPLSNPLYFASLMSEVRKDTGSFTPGSAGIQKFINKHGGGLKLDAKTRGAIDMFRTNPAIVWGMLGHEGLKPEIYENVQWKAIYDAAKNMGMSDAKAKTYADGFTFAVMPEAAKDQFLPSKGYGPMMAGPTEDMDSFNAKLNLAAMSAGVGTFKAPGKELFGKGKADPLGLRKKISLGRIGRTDFKKPALSNPYGLSGSLLEASRETESGRLNTELEGAGVTVKSFGDIMINTSRIVVKFEDTVGHAIDWIRSKTDSSTTGRRTPP